MSRVAFWASAGLIVYTYLVFPMIVVLRGVLRHRPVAAGRIEPFVSLLIAARNEEAAIGDKIVNLLQLDYPSDRLEVIVASDGSTDGTVRVVRAALDDPTDVVVQVLDLPASGKAIALTAAVAASHGDILVFSDANSMYARDALRALVAPFADPSVGGVAGNQIYAHAEQSGAEAGELGYWDYDRILKEFESRGGSAIGGTGAIYAIRRSLFRPIPPAVNDDFYLTAGVVDQGARLVFAAGAVAWEPPASGVGAEYGRKVRIVSRAMRCIASMPRLLDPRLHGFYSLQLLSHKVLRWTMGLPLMVLFGASSILAHRNPSHRRFFLLQLTFYVLAATGTIARGTRMARARPLSIPAYFVMVNVAGLRGLWNLIRDHRVDQWQPVRGAVTKPAGQR